jgi:hypothetical protein
MNGVKSAEIGRFTAKQDRLALLLAEGKTIRAAAGEIGIAERTAYTYVHIPSFQARVSELRGRMLDAALGRLAESATKAVDTLVKLLDDSRANVQLRASLGLLRVLTRVREVVEFEQRLSVLEADHASGTREEIVSAGGRLERQTRAYEQRTWKGP